MNSQPFGPWLATAIFLALATFSVSLIPYFFPTAFSTFLEKWRSLNSLKKLALIGILIGVTAFGGTKPSSGDSTNSVPDDASSPTNQPPPVLMATRPQLVPSAPPSYASQPSQLVTNWTVRGAYCDWVHITFPDGFAFPSGTNLMTGVTVMAYGTLRQTLKDPTPIAALPQEVSLEPSVSSFVYGLTSSNSFVFAWSNVCVNRSLTNRVDASIELFRNGACSVRFDTVETFYPALPPPDYVGSAQDDNWLAAAFSPSDYAAITNKGYARWLMEDKVGINEQNGLYKATITVHSMPPNDEPCYLECGPYRVVVTEPGEYSFPLQVFTHYTARTYPAPVPLSVEYDDGYRGTPSLLGAPAPQNSAPRLMGFGLPLIVPLPIFLDASMHVWPSSIELNQARNSTIEVWCNVAGSPQLQCESLYGETETRFISPSIVEIVEARAEDLMRIFLALDNLSCSCEIPITVPDYYHWCCCGNCSGENCSCGCDCLNHHIHDEGTNAPPQTGTQP